MPGRWRCSLNARRRRRCGFGRGFTLIELLVVLAIVGIASAVIAVALPSGAQSRLDEEAERLAALLESARTEARAAGLTVTWTPTNPEAAAGAEFRFVGLPPNLKLPDRWLAAGVSAEVIGARGLLLGPEPVLPPQQVVLRLADRRVVLGSDGLAPFAVKSSEKVSSP